MTSSSSWPIYRARSVASGPATPNPPLRPAAAGAIGADDALERVHYFLDVVEMEVLGSALIAGLRPAAL